MRITREAKAATRERVVAAALEAFQKHGFESTTTRDIAAAAGIATGTLFNYFDSKEAILGSLVQQTLVKATSRFRWNSAEGDLDEALFAYIAAELRQLKPMRKLIKSLLETSLSALVPSSDSAHVLGVRHIDTVAELALQHGLPNLTPVAKQVYWSLYVGVLAFWAVDRSPKQEDTLALLDESLAMYVAWLRSENRTPSK